MPNLSPWVCRSALLSFSSWALTSFLEQEETTGVHLIKASTTVSLQPFTQDCIISHFQALQKSLLPFRGHGRCFSIWNRFEEPSGNLWLIPAFGHRCLSHSLLAPGLVYLAAQPWAWYCTWKPTWTYCIMFPTHINSSWTFHAHDAGQCFSVNSLPLAGDRKFKLVAFQTMAVLLMRSKELVSFKEATATWPRGSNWHQATESELRWL